MKTHPSTHRHFVVAPVCALLLAISLLPLQSESEVAASLSWVQVGESRRDFQFASGLHGTVYDGELSAQESEVHFARGEALFATTGVASVQVGDAVISLYDGAAHIAHSDTALSVSALSSPVLVKRGEAAMVVPVGRQWRLSHAQAFAPLGEEVESWFQARATAPLPTSFVHRELQTLSSIPVPQVAELQPGVTTLPFYANLLLPAAQDRLFSSYTLGVLNEFRVAVRNGDIETIESLQQDERSAAVLMSLAGLTVAAELLAEEGTLMPAVSMVLHELTVHDERFWLLAAYHPDHQNIAWLHDRINSSQELHAVRLLLFPQSLFQVTSPADIVWQRYGTGVSTLLDHLADGAVQEYFIATSTPLVAMLAERGYPVRSEQLALLLESLFPAEDTALLLEAKTRLQARNHVSLEPLPEEEPEPVDVEEEPVQPVEPVVVHDPDTVEEMAYNMLQEAGALFTVRTTVSATEPNIARIRDIVFGGSTQDRQVSFSLNVETKQVTAIEYQGSTDFPFDPPFEAFIRWITQ